MATKRSSDDSGDKALHKAKKQHATHTLSPVGEVSEEDEQRGREEEKKKRTRSGKPKEKPKPKPYHHNSGASAPPPMEGKRRKKKQPPVHLTVPLEEQSPRKEVPLEEICDLLQAAVAEVGEKLPVPEVVAIGGQSHGKSSLLEALLGFRFNAGDDEMGTRRPLFLQMRHDSTAVEPKFRFQEENSEKYESQMVAASDISGIIKRRNESHLKEIKADVSAKPIVIRAEFAGWPNFTIIDTPGLAKSGEKEDTADQILKIVKSLATPPTRLLLFCQHIGQSIFPDTLKMLKMIGPSFRHTMIVLFMFDDELKQSKEEIHTLFRTTSMKLGTSIHPFFVAIPKHHGPKDTGVLSSEDFLRQTYKLDNAVRYIGAFNEAGSHIGLSCLRNHLKSEIDTMYRKKVAPATLALFQQRCTEASEKLMRLETKLQAMSGVSQLRESAMRYAHSFSTHLRALLDGAEGPDPEHWGKTTADELSASDIRSWPCINEPVQPTNSTLKLYGVAAFERVMDEFGLATKSMASPPLPMDQVGNIVLALASAGSSELDKAGAEVACTLARSGLARLIGTACDRLAFVLTELFDITMEHIHKKDSQYQNIEHMDVYVDFLAALRYSYDKFVEKLSKKCKKTVQHRLDSAISTYSHIFNENEALEDMSSTTDKEDSVVGYKRKDNANGAIPKITGNADIETIYPGICAASGNYFAEIRDLLIKKDAPTALRSGFLKPCRDELLPALFNVLFGVDDEVFMGMFDTHGALNTINNERKSLVKRQKGLVSFREYIRNISEWFMSSR